MTAVNDRILYGNVGAAIRLELFAITGCYYEDFGTINVVV